MSVVVAGQRAVVLVPEAESPKAIALAVVAAAGLPPVSVQAERLATADAGPQCAAAEPQLSLAVAVDP